MSWLDLVKALVPVILAKAAPNASPVLGGLIVHGIEGAEALHATHGADKLAHATDFVVTGIAGVNAVKPGLIDPQLGVVIPDAISDAVDIANRLHKPAAAA